MDDLLTRQLPHSLEGEQAVLGSMLIDPRCIPEVVEHLRPDDFYLPQNKDIFQTIYGMFSLSQTIDPVTVLDQMRVNGVYDENTSRGYLLQLMDITPTSANVMEYVDIVRDKAMLRRLAEAAADITAMVQEGAGEAGDLLEAAERRIYAIRQGRADDGLIPIQTLTLDYYDRLDELSSQGNQIPGISTGLSGLDAALSGLNKGELILLAARPGMGKTSLALNIALYAGKHINKTVAFFSLEMSREQLVGRLISNEAFVDGKRLYAGNLQEDDWTRVHAAVAALNKTDIRVDDNGSLTVADMNARCRRVKDLGLVIIDYLQLMQSSGNEHRGNENRQQIVADITRSLKIMAKDLNVPVLCLSQLSRANESRKDKRPLLSDLRESGAIEQDADVVLFLYREGYYDDAAEDPNLAECIISKNRHGETGTVFLRWLPQYTTFCTPERRYEEE